MAEPSNPSVPLVSVVIGAFNAEDHLPGALECVLAQTFSDLEIIVVDDASRDGTVAVAESYGDRVRLVRRSSNSATCERPRYQGVKAARGTYCAFLDADDRWDPEFLEKMMGYMRARPETALAHSYVRVVDGEDRVLRVRHEGTMPEGAEVARALLRHCFITASAVVVRREAWLAAVPEEEIVDFGMDQDFFLAIARKGSIGFVPEVLASYRRSDFSVSVKKWRRMPRNVHTLERLWRKRAWRGIATRREMLRILEEAYAENAEHWQACGEPFRAVWFGIRGLRRRPFSLRLWHRLAAGLGSALARACAPSRAR